MNPILWHGCSGKLWTTECVKQSACCTPTNGRELKAPMRAALDMTHLAQLAALFSGATTLMSVTKFNQLIPMLVAPWSEAARIPDLKCHISQVSPHMEPCQAMLVNCKFGVC